MEECETEHQDVLNTLNEIESLETNKSKSSSETDVREQYYRKEEGCTSPNPLKSICSDDCKSTSSENLSGQEIVLAKCDIDLCSTSHDSVMHKHSSDALKHELNPNSWNYKIYYKLPLSSDDNSKNVISNNVCEKMIAERTFDASNSKLPSTPGKNYSSDDEALCVALQRPVENAKPSHSICEQNESNDSSFSSVSHTNLCHKNSSESSLFSNELTEVSSNFIAVNQKEALCEDFQGKETAEKMNMDEVNCSKFDYSMLNRFKVSTALENDVSSFTHQLSSDNENRTTTSNVHNSIHKTQLCDNSSDLQITSDLDMDEVHMTENKILMNLHDGISNIKIEDKESNDVRRIDSHSLSCSTFVDSDENIENSDDFSNDFDVKLDISTNKHKSEMYFSNTNTKDIEVRPISLQRNKKIETSSGESCVESESQNFETEKPMGAYYYENTSVSEIRGELKDLEFQPVKVEHLSGEESECYENKDLPNSLFVDVGEFSQEHIFDLGLKVDEFVKDISEKKILSDLNVSLQEDMNGNLSMGEFSEKDLSVAHQSQPSKSVFNLNKSSENEQQTHQYVCSVVKEGTLVHKNSKLANNTYKHSPINEEEHAVSLNSALLKKNENETFRGQLSSIDSFSENDTKAIGIKTLSNGEITAFSSNMSDDIHTVDDIPSSVQDSVEPERNISDFKESPDTRLVFSPTDGIFRSIPYTESLDKNESSDDHVVQNDVPMLSKDMENNDFLMSDSQLSARLQRPTTLDLPCCPISSPQVMPMVSDSIQSSVTTRFEEPIVGTLVDLDDSSSACPQVNMAARNFCQENDKLEMESQVQHIGIVKPFWIPDSEASNCMHCNMKFTVIKRRHHCRACGKVLCSRCCNQKARLPYLQNKEDRVCQQCFEVLSNSQSDFAAANSGESPASSSCGSSPSFSPPLSNANAPVKEYWKPHPNNPGDYCSTVSPLQQMQQLANRPPPTVMVPVGVLKRGNKPRGEPKQVIFSDGIRPGGDLTDLTEPMEVIPPYQRQGRRRVDKLLMGGESSQALPVSNYSSAAKKKGTQPKSRHKRIVVVDSEGSLPPVLLLRDDPTADDKMDIATFLARLKDELASPVIFAIIKNLHILAKIIKLDCCFGKECWCFASQGLCTVGQDEVIFLLERLPDEDVVPRDVFRLFNKVYDNATKGSTVGDLGYLIFSDGVFGSWDHRGFLFIRPTFQCLRKLVLPGTPFLCAVLIQKWEVPWAKVFPLRLMLRLGAECRYYPCPLVSIRSRKPVYFEIGQTIMNVLADLRNYQFTIPFVPGLVVHMEEKKTSVIIPRNRYEQLMKVLNSNNVEHVLALGANFSSDADSHLVCMQKDEGDYHTQAINIEHTPRKVTGASFIVFSGALKSSTGLTAKFNIVEDGLLVQIPQETMTALHSALHDMHDLTVKCGPVNAPEPEEVVTIQWAEDDRRFNIGVASPVDGKNLEGIPSLRIHTSTDYANENYLIRWTEVFFMELDRNGNSMRVETIDPCKVAESVAQAFCVALLPYLDALAESEMTRIGLRILLDAERDKVEYEAGALEKPLPSMYMNALDSSLIPIISRVTGVSHDEPIALELIFYILIK